RLFRLPEHRDRAASLFDRFAGAVAERMGFHRQSALDAARSQNFDLLVPLDQAGLVQRLGVDLAPVREPAELGDVDNRVDLLEPVLDAGQLGEALGKGHLAAFEAEAKSFAAGVLSLLAAAG